MHSYGKGRAGVGLTTVDSVTRKRRLCRPSWATVCSSAMRRPTKLRWCRLRCTGGRLRTTIQSISSFFCFFIQGFSRESFLLFLHSGIFSGVVSFGFVHWGFFVLGTRTLCKGGVMIRWLGPWDAVWEPANISLLFVCNGRVLGTIEHLIH